MNKELTATIINYDYVPSTPSYIKQGVKGNRTPSGAITGGNGSFVIKGDPPQVILEINTTNNKDYEFDIYTIIKDYTSRARITKKYCNDIFNELVGIEIAIPEDERVSTYIYQKVSELVKESVERIDK